MRGEERAMKYLWEETADRKVCEVPKGDIETDVLVIGGGIAGIMCAYMLSQNGVDCVVAEAKTIGSGTSAGTTAALTPQHGNIYTRITKKYGKDTAKGYLEANLQAVKEYEKLAGKFDFDFEYKDSYIYSRDDEKSMKLEAAIVRELGFAAEFTDHVELPLKVAGAVRFPHMAEFHPLKLIFALSGKLKIYENMQITELRDDKAYFNGGTVKAKKTVIATRFPFINMYGLYPLKLYQKRSFVLALENAPDVKGTYADVAERGIYMRNYRDLLIVGGGDYRTGTKNDGFETVRSFVREYLPGSTEKYAWAVQDCISLDGIPYIGDYSTMMDNTYVISGFNEWGMSSAMAAASIITDRITGRENQFEHVFSPKRSIFTKQTAVNALETVKNFLTPGARRCAHLGCALKKNTDENTWDCPCHGSRFDAEGKLIDNPSVHDLR